MIFASPEDALAYVKANSKTIPAWVTKARAYSKELCALVDGEGFLEELINKIEGIESEAKAAARKKYSKSIKSFFARLSSPIQNVFSATGGVKDYANGKAKLSEVNLQNLISIISNIRDNKSIENYIETKWLPLYHTDPAGVLWMQYKTDAGELTEVYPTYQSIVMIRNYSPDGQLVENILFEPKDIAEDTKQWILVDDKMQYCILQKSDIFTIDEDPLKTFEHPFGSVPVIIISNLTDKNDNRLSPFDIIIDDAKEYARDLSMKTITKALHGTIMHWRREAICAICHGTRKNGDEKCTSCQPTGKTGKSDVTDKIILPFNPDSEKQLSGNDIAGWVAPDTNTWKAYSEELEGSENLIYESLWGTVNKAKLQGAAKTATEIHYDTQPQIKKLNKYADVAEWIEWTITEWVANIVDMAKAKDQQISLIVYGRRYILEGIDQIQEKYEKAKEAGDNSVILDGIFDELLTVKFKNDPQCMMIELKKAKCEPYIHNSTDQINTYFGAKEVARKMYFQQWWKNLSDQELQGDVKTLQAKFNSDFSVYLPTVEIMTPAPAAAPAGPAPTN